MNDLFRRSYGIAVRAMAEDKRSVDVVASSTAIDGYGEIVAQDWDLTRYAANPVVLYGHNSYGLPIGHASNVRVEDGKLLASLNFVDARANPMAEMVWQGIVQGSLRAVSVGFRSKSAQMQNVNGKDVFVLTGNELMEISVVPIPANPEAVAVAAKAFDDQVRALIARSQKTENDMNVKQIAIALGLAETTTEEEALAFAKALAEDGKALKALLAAVGADSHDKALGIVTAWKAAAEQLEAANAKLAELEQANVARELDALIAKGKADRKLTPALEEWARSVGIDTLKAFLEKAPAIPALAEKGETQVQPTPTTNASDAELIAKLLEKGWKQLTPMEKHQLYTLDKSAYEAAKNQTTR
jgi:HK97 family phage prohead protease